MSAAHLDLPLVPDRLPVGWSPCALSAFAGVEMTVELVAGMAVHLLTPLAEPSPVMCV